MQRILILLLFALAICPVHANETIQPPRDPGYKLVWADEFEKDGPPDPTKWISENGFTRNKELQWYQPQNSNCQGGVLIIEAKRERVKNPGYVRDSRDWRKNRSAAEYTSGSLVTVRGQEWYFGRAEVRARFKALPGLWPAIWTTGLGHWPHAGEIDIMEFYRGKILANFVWAGKGGKDLWASSHHPIEKFRKDTWDDRFHLWVAEWDQEKISIYLDGQLLNTLPMERATNLHGPPINPFLKPQSFRLNLAIGSSGGDPSRTTFPQRFEVDYVRIYQK